MFKFYLIFIPFFVGIVFGLPMKDHDFENSLLQNKLRQLNLFEDSIGLVNSMRNIPIPVELNPKSERILKNIYYSTDEKNNPFSKFLIQNKWNMDSNDQDKFIYYSPKMLKNFDNIPVGNLLRDMDSVDAGHLIKRTLDSIGGANLLKK